MLPSLLNSSYDKIFVSSTPLDPQLSKVKLFGKNEVSFSSLRCGRSSPSDAVGRKRDLVLGNTRPGIRNKLKTENGIALIRRIKRTSLSES